MISQEKIQELTNQHLSRKRKQTLGEWLVEDTQGLSYLMSDKSDWSIDMEFIDALYYILTRPKVMWYQPDKCDLLPHLHQDVVNYIYDLIHDYISSEEATQVRAHLEFSNKQSAAYRGVMFTQLEKLGYGRIIYGATIV
jgi:hypothetical protein